MLKNKGKMGMLKVFSSIGCMVFSAMVFAMSEPIQSPGSPPSKENFIDSLQKAMMDNDLRKFQELLSTASKITPPIPDSVWKTIFAKAEYLKKDNFAQAIERGRGFSQEEVYSYNSDIDSPDWIITQIETDQTPMKFLLFRNQEKMAAAEKKFFDKSEHPVLISDEVFLADLLALKYLNKDGAVKELKDLKIKHPLRFKNFQDALFLTQLDSIFAKKPFKEVAAWFSDDSQLGDPPSQKNFIDNLQKAMMGLNIRNFQEWLGTTHKMTRPIPDSVWKTTFVKAKYLKKDGFAAAIKRAHPEAFLHFDEHNWDLDSVDWLIMRMEIAPTEFKTIFAHAQRSMESLEKKFLKESESPVLISDEIFLADLLALKHLDKEKAISEVTALKIKYPPRFKNFQDALFLSQLDSVLTKKIFKETAARVFNNEQRGGPTSNKNFIDSLDKAMMTKDLRKFQELLATADKITPPIPDFVWEIILDKVRYMKKENFTQAIGMAFPRHLSQIHPQGETLDSVDWLIMKIEMTPIDLIDFVKDSKSSMESLEKRFFEKSENPVLISDEIFLADLLALKHLNRDGAVEELKVLKIKYLQRFKNFQDALFLTQLDSIFARPHFKEFAARFSENRWKGHTQAIRELNPEAPIHEVLEKETMDVEVLGIKHTLTYTLLKTSEAPPQSIVIDVYTGYSKDFCQRNRRPVNFRDPSILSIELDLWDCKSDVDQSKQLTEKNFKTTHFSYLLGVSQFIAHIAEKYSGAKIYLMGQSFGGFFVTAYALLQSVLQRHIPLHEVYEGPFVIDEFKGLHADSLGKIHGFISTSGAIDYIDVGGAMAKPRALKFLTIPGFFSFNYDDDRVRIETIKRSLEAAPIGIIELFVDREGARAYGHDINNHDSLESSTTRGHYSSTVNPSQMIELRAFIHRTATNQPQSKVQLAIQERRRKIFLEMRDKDKEQYLSNLSKTQYLIETKRKTNPNFQLTKEELLEHHTEGITSSGDEETREKEWEGKVRATSSKKILQAAGKRVVEEPASKANVKKKIQLKKEILKKSNSKNFGLVPLPPSVKVKNGSESDT